MQLILQKRKFSNRNYKFTPIFLPLEQDTFDTVAELVNSYEINLGTRNIDFYDEEYFISKFNDIRVFKNINYILTRYYYSYSISEVFPDYSPSELRIRVYKLFNENNLSFVLPKNKDSFFLEFSEQLGLNVEVVKKNLFSDHAIFKILIRKNFNEIEDNPPLPKEVVIAYNKEITKSIINRSYWFDFTFNSNLINGTQFKRLIFLTKRLGLYYESNNIDNDIIKFRILGPQELVGRSTKYGRNLNVLLLKNLDFFINNNLVVDFLINHFGQRREVSIDFSLIKNMLDITEVDINNYHEEFDSKIEEKFNNMISSLDKKWEITREPVIIENGIIMIPDFKLQYYQTTIYVEIVGFWTEKYLNHKVRKVRLLENKYKDMILFIDESLNFPSTKLKTFQYGKDIHISDFLRYIKEKYELPYIKTSVQEIKKDKIKIFTAINNLISKNNVISFNNLILALPQLKNIETLLELIYEDFFLNEHDIKFIVAYNSQLLINLGTIQLLKNQLKEFYSINQIWKFEDLFGNFSQSNLKENELRTALKILGCHWKIRNLVEEYVFLPKKEINVTSLSKQLNI